MPGETVANLDTVPRDVVFYLVPEFDILSFGAAIEAFRLTNLALGYEAYNWRFVSADGCNVRASCGLDIQTVNSIHRERSYLVGGKRPDKVIVCSGPNVDRYRDRAVDAWLRECSHRGVVLAALSSGAQYWQRQASSKAADALFIGRIFLRSSNITPGLASVWASTRLMETFIPRREAPLP